MRARGITPHIRQGRASAARASARQAATLGREADLTPNADPEIMSVR